MNTCETFEAAVRYIKAGDYVKAIYVIKSNQPSDQRIIERRIEQAMAKQDQQS